MRLVKIESVDHTEGRVASGGLGSMWINPERVQWLRVTGDETELNLLASQSLYVRESLDEMADKLMFEGRDV